MSCNNSNFFFSSFCKRKCQTISDKSVTKLRFFARRLVLATGNSTVPIPLNVPGESHNFVSHSLDQLDSIIKSGRLHRPSTSSYDTVLLVGSGLSAADAINLINHCKASLRKPVRIVHLFRRSINDRQLIFNYLSNERAYPEYHRVYSQMKQTTKQPLCLACFTKNSSTAKYQAYQQCSVSHIGSNRVVTLSFADAESSNSLCYKCHQPLSNTSTLKVSLVQILIGTRPELKFLSDDLACKLGASSKLPIDSRHNPLMINPWTYEAVNVKQLYAIGPLAGDNFVRFVQGGSLAVAKHIVSVADSVPSCDNVT